MTMGLQGTNVELPVNFEEYGHRIWLCETPFLRSEDRNVDRSVISILHEFAEHVIHVLLLFFNSSYLG